MQNKGDSRYQRQLKGKQGQSSVRLQGQIERRQVGSRETLERTRARIEGDAIDRTFGFERLKEGLPRLGWLLNYLPITMPDETGMEKSGMDLYFIDQEGGSFKASIFYAPYFFIDYSDPRRSVELTQHLLKKFEGCSVSTIDKEDLDMPNHLSGRRHKFLKIEFRTVNDMNDAKNILRPIVMENQKRLATSEDFFVDAHEMDASQVGNAQDLPTATIVDLREHDVLYPMRVSIDLELRVGSWFVVTPEYGSEVCSVAWQKEMLEKCEPRMLAFDIECEKSPLKFPNPEVDRIYMISYMVANQGYLIINREIVSEDIENFEYTPKPHYPGHFEVFNLKNEEACLQFFVDHIKQLKPHVFVTYNGDKFDFPYVEIRCSKYPSLGTLYSQLGMKNLSSNASGAARRAQFAPRDGEEQPSEENEKPAAALFSEGEYTGRCIVHLDAFAWVQRDSYLPQGTQGLKAVTKHKLGYDPVEVDPEDMLRFAQERPHYMASYSVSDAVATYYLYTTYVHNFIFSLSTIIPLASEDVLRKGSGTLCEALLMVEAYRGNIICPNKQVDPLESYHENHLLESETYIGGHVECLEAGVFRADIPAKFNLVPSALQQLINNIDRDLTFALEVEHGLQRTDALNYDEIKQAIVTKLEYLRDNPVREEGPIIYHLDVGAMYPNIILTNRLQPAAIVSTSDCAACEFNRAENGCKRPMNWTWRGEYSPATANEYVSVKRQLTYEKITPKGETIAKPYTELDEKEQIRLAKERLKLYSQRVYRKTKITSEVERTSTVCMRENSFYVDTVKAFRDRRYDYKLLTKTWKNKKTAAEKANDPVGRKFAEDREVLMDSLQLAHKCILNSFYGYVMRKGARWRSMEMAGIVTHTGALLIKQARELVEQVGRPLELDTDGIWCILPSSFPQDFKMKTRSSGNVSIGYPCAMLNADVHERYTNHQYQDLSNSNVPGGVKKYDKHSECSIFFELDGPYKAMVLPASPEEGKLLKKKYVVFNFNGSIAELKGFELKRRGELELVKIFQSQVFDQFLSGGNLTECYASVGAIANQWLDVLDEKGYSMDDSELLELISERKTISKTVEDYAGRKSTSLTTAGRLADFLGAEMIKDKGLNCNLIISRLPAGAPVTERAIPVAIFSCEPAVRKYYLRKWLKDNTLDCEDFRDVVDWQYYKERLGKSIQKIITIPAGIQRVINPCPRVEHPSWLAKQIAEKNSGRKQMSILASFKSVAASTVPGAMLLTNSTAPVRKVNLFGDRPNTVSLVDGEEAPNSASKKRVRPVEGAGGELGDLEDIGASTSPSGLKGVPRAHNFKGRSATGAHASGGSDENDDGNQDDDAAVEEAVDAVTDKMARIVLPMSEHKPEDMEEMQSWLSNRKDHWKKLRAERRANKQLLTGGGAGGRTYGNAYRPGTAVGNYSNTSNVTAYSGKKAIGVLDYVRNAQLAITQHCWQVLELQETDVPGEFKVWALTTPTQLQCVTMVIARTLYVNVTGAEAQLAAESLGGVKVKRDLPHAKPGHVLYEISIPEHKYIRNEKALNLFLSNGQVEGVYESQVPLNLRGVLQMGCVTRCINAKAQMSSNKFKLNDMELVHTNSFPYLEKGVATFKRIFVYFANNSNSTGNLGVLALFVVDTNNVEEENTFKSSTRTGSSEFTTVADVPLGAKAFVWLINGRGAATMDTVPPLQKIYRRFQPNGTANVKFVSTFARTAADAYRLCNEKLMNYQRERHGPTIIIAQGGAMDAASWRYNVPMLHEYPLSVIPTNNSDNLYPAVGWQFFTCERLVQRYLIVPSWFYDRVSCARYAHIPVCNLGTDALTTIIDTIYSRQLIHNRHLLWCSEGSNTPDIGTSATSATDSALVQLDDVNSSVNEVVINNSGVYRNICIELDVYGLAVCSIMSSGELDAEGLTALNVNTSSGGKNTSATAAAAAVGEGEEEGGVGGGGGEEKLPMVAHASGDSSCARAFSILKAMVTKCIEEVARRNDRISDSILTALYRYLCGYGNGLLSDPALHKVVHNLMTQLFKKLITGFKKLGTKVIYADFGRIIVATNKQDYASAKEYIDFIVSAITAKDIFAFVQVNVKSYWEQLVWLGPENFGGIPLTDDKEVELEEGAAGEPEVVDISEDAPTTSAGTVAGTATTVVDMTEEPETVGTPVGTHTDDEEEQEEEPEEVSTQRVEEVEVVAPAAAPVPKPVKIASIFAKRGASAASGAATGAAEEQPATAVNVLTPFDAVKTLDKSKSKISKLASHKFQRETVKSSEYDFLDDVNNGLADENGDLNLDSIKNAYRSRRPANKKRTGGAGKKNKKTVRYEDEDGILNEEEDGASEGEYSDDSERGDEDDDYRSVDEGGDRWLDNDADPYYGSGGGAGGEQFYQEEAEEDGPAVSHWNLVTYYPPAVATFFRFIIQEFLLQYQAKRDELLAVREARLSGGMSQYSQMQQEIESNPLDDESVALMVTEYMKKFITQRFTTKMLEFIDEINAAYPMLHGAATTAVTDSETHETVINSVFPKRAGSHLRMTSPALEFVKATTHVMSLDPTVREEVSTLKRMLLAQLRVREFNEESQFKDPCLSFMLRDVICSFCSTCRDLDLLRDGTLTNDDASVRWLCVHCSNTINTEEVENRLLDEVDKLTAVYLMQDVRCAKTKRASQRHATAVSDFCQPLVMDFDQASVRQKLNILLKVAEYHEFKYLEVAVKDLIALHH